MHEIKQNFAELCGITLSSGIHLAIASAVPEVSAMHSLITMSMGAVITGLIGGSCGHLAKLGIDHIRVTIKKRKSKK